MDLLAHVVYGATVCSRTGLAGGAVGTKTRPWLTDWTVWCAVLFALLPDAVSMGMPFLAHWENGMEGHFFRDIGDDAILRYRYMHSLLVALAVSGLLRLAWKPLFVPSLAWALHVIMDALTHGAGKYQTTVFYPLSTWAFEGIRWWQHPELVIGYWILLPVIWLALWMWRRRERGKG
jgi:hypothetical protein